MKLEIRSLNESFKKSYRNESIVIETYKNFIEKLNKYFNSIKNAQNTNESAQKPYLRDFLKSTLYKNHYINEKTYNGLIGPDLVISKNSNSSVEVLFELKTKRNTEMIDHDNINKKSFHELILYYLYEKTTERNDQIKNLIITNFDDWYVFDSKEIQKLFYKPEIKNYFNDWRNDKTDNPRTDQMYDFIQGFIEREDSVLSSTYFKISDIIKNENEKMLYRFFSKENLLREFNDDRNSLNKNFYYELLYLIGIQEIEKNGKIILEKGDNKGSFLDCIQQSIESDGVFDNIPNIKRFGNNYEDQIFGVGLELAITWINRLIFLKLLETNVVNFQRDNSDYKFFRKEVLEDFDKVNALFFDVLSKKDRIAASFTNFNVDFIPYLNSSLFEPSELEKKTIRISNLADHVTIRKYKRSCLSEKSELKLLEYFIDFINYYDFGIESSSGEFISERKPLINSSVLGLIFEKINGYKDGSVYTPSYITSQMCEITLQKSVLANFNQEFGWNCKSIKDLKNHMERSNDKEYIRLFNELKICDPAVGSGHYLVSMLNQIIKLKSELGILYSEYEDRIRDIQIGVDNDELTIQYNEEPYRYRLSENGKVKSDIQKIQETIFYQKKIIIENSLFGVDINSNSVNICRLRLWIELLKNSFYKKESDFKELETLPNIDINIKVGNSLIHKFQLNEPLKTLIKDRKGLDGYKKLVFDYKRTNDKSIKNKLVKKLSDLKEQIQKSVPQNLIIKRQNLHSQLDDFTKAVKNYKLLDLKKSKKDEKQIQDLRNKIDKVESQISGFQNSEIYSDSFEWRFEFPELLNIDGKFTGFDIIIGNPPYIQLQKIRSEATRFKNQGYSTFERTGDIYCLFYEKGLSLLKPNGFLCYITSNKWMRSKYGEKLRDLFSKMNPLILLDLGPRIFDSVTVDTNILLIQNRHKEKHNLKAISTDGKQFDIQLLEKKDYTIIPKLSKENWVILSPIEQSIKEKIEKMGTPLKDWDIKINYGVKTGYNRAFIIDGAKRDELIQKDPKSAEIIRPQKCRGYMTITSGKRY
ncbi:MAG: Eco57I restriction-modification methylase domain-containing protein [Flavobacteriaceae bacterium]|nr:Eco57I restriction-modification methylase domain-containing protein [Flavobacteriaceae bacterium]